MEIERQRERGAESSSEHGGMPSVRRRRACEHCPIGHHALITVDQGQDIPIFNPAAGEMFGCAAADIPGTPLEQFHPPRSGMRGAC